MTDNSALTAKPRGFQLNPQDINKNGRPKKDESITHLVRQLLRKKPQGQEKTYRQLFAMRVMKLALEGDMTAIKEIWNRMDGAQKILEIDMSGSNIIVQPILGGRSINVCPKCGEQI